MNNNPRQLLAKIRNGDYAHAGEVEAIDIVLTTLSNMIDLQAQPLNIIDIGCGLGGTADYLRRNTRAQMVGLDMDKEAINYAKSHYPKVDFVEGNILNIDKTFATQQFDLMFLFNVFYAFKNKSVVLQKLKKIAKPNCILTIFDYVSFIQDATIQKDLAGADMYPIVIDELKKDLDKTNWKLIEIIDVSDRYAFWYADFLDKLHANKQTLLSILANKPLTKLI